MSLWLLLQGARAGSWRRLHALPLWVASTKACRRAETLTLRDRLRKAGVPVPVRFIQHVPERYGCSPKNESDFCVRCGASFRVGLPFYSTKQKNKIRATIWNRWRLEALKVAPPPSP